MRVGRELDKGGGMLMIMISNINERVQETATLSFLREIYMEDHESYLVQRRDVHFLISCQTS